MLVAGGGGVTGKYREKVEVWCGEHTVYNPSLQGLQGSSLQGQPCLPYIFLIYILSVINLSD